MPSEILVEHSALPNEDFEVCLRCALSFKDIQQGGEGTLGDKCLVFELGSLLQIKRFLRLRLLGHQPSKVKLQTPRNSGKGPSARFHEQLSSLNTGFYLE